MMSSIVDISFSRNDHGVSSITFNLLPRNETDWGVCSLIFASNGSLKVSIHNYFQDASVVFGQISLLANAFNVEASFLELSVKSTQEMNQDEFVSLLPRIVRDLDNLVNQVEHYFIQAAQLHFEWETKQCMVKNRHVHVKGSVGSFSIPFTMLIEIVADTQRKPVPSALGSRSHKNRL